jgi:putative hydrolase of the HAD superfamily
MRAVIFDYGMVLCYRDPDAYRHLLEVTRLDAPAFERTYWHDRHQYDLGRLDAATFWRQFGEHAGRTFTEAEIDRLIECDVRLWTPTDPVMVGWAAALQKSGLRTAILSNMGPDLLNLMRRSPDFAWLRAFTHLTFSCELHIAKPDPAIYLWTCEKLGVPPEECLFIDDKPENVAAAEALGMHAIPFHDADQLRAELARRHLFQDYPQPEAPGAPPRGADLLTAAL